MDIRLLAHWALEIGAFAAIVGLFRLARPIRRLLFPSVP